MPIIDDDKKGEIWPTANPGPDGANYGSVRLISENKVEIRSFQTLTFVFEVGEYGLDDTGAIKIVQRWTPDGGSLQCHDPAGLNFVSAKTSGDAQLEIYCDPYPHQRPWYNGVRVTVSHGYLSPGDTVEVIYGDKSQGSPGYRVQTFPESAHEFKVLADPCATGVFIPIGSATIEIIPGQVDNWVLVAPTHRKPEQPFSLGIRPQDAWGNSTDQFSGCLTLRSNGSVKGLPEVLEFPAGECAHTISGLSVSEEVVTRFQLLDENGNLLATSNPLLTKESSQIGYWGDLHGQSGETVGINPLREYFDFARDVAFLDVTSHQANDFQVTNEFWSEINSLSADCNVDGEFVVFPGYEWSGNTPVGGDHNVFFRNEGEQIHRSSHALLEDRNDIETDARNLGELFSKLDGRDCVLYAHIGGRPADIAYAENAQLRTAVEVHSDWGTFEWVLTDAFALGYRVGVVCNSDGHKGAPGACYPGASEFGAYSGLTCFLADQLDRDAIFGSMRARHHYGTTGCRMHLSVSASLGESGQVYPQDPRISDNPPVISKTAMMGDIVSTGSAQIDLDIEVLAHAPIERIEVFNGPDQVSQFKPFGPEELGKRVCIIWEGAEYRGRGRTTSWDGMISFEGSKITGFRTINAWNLERDLRQLDDNSIKVDAVTTGNFGGCHVWLEDITAGGLKIRTNHVKTDIPLKDIGYEELVFEAGGLGRRMRVFRLPENMTVCDVEKNVSVDIEIGRDNPIWVKVTTEDGFNAWSSPIYVLR